MNLLNKVINPYWTWFILIFFNGLVYAIIGFEGAVLTAAWLLLYSQIAMEENTIKTDSEAKNGH